MVNPLQTPDAYDYILLSGQKSPGLAVISGATSPRIWDKKRGFGYTGATLTYGGDDLSEFTVTFRMWEVEHFDEWDSFKKLLTKPPTSAKPKALEIIHPYLQELGIKSVVVTSLGQMEQTEDGMWEVPVKFFQYRAPKPILVTPDGSKVDNNPPADTKYSGRVQEALNKLENTFKEN